MCVYVGRTVRSSTMTPLTNQMRGYISRKTIVSSLVSNCTVVLYNHFHHLPVSQYQAVHLPWGVPRGGEGSSSCLLTQPHYITLYSSALHIPLWTAYKLTSSVCNYLHLWHSCSKFCIYSVYLLSFQQASRNPRFNGSCLRRDPRLLPTNSANCTDYTENGSSDEFVPIRMAAGLSTSTPDQLTTNLLSNVLPQINKFNTSKH